MNLNDCHNFQDFRRLAKKRLPSPIFHYIDGAADDEITTNDGGKFKVIQIDTTNNNIYLTAEIPLITNTSTLTNTTQSIASLSINSFTAPEVKNSSGEIIYLDNRSPIIRSADQVEQIKALIRF